MQSDCAVNKCLHTVASSWTFLLTGKMIIKKFNVTVQVSVYHNAISLCPLPHHTNSLNLVQCITYNHMKVFQLLDAERHLLHDEKYSNAINIIHKSSDHVTLKKSSSQVLPT